MGGDDLDEDGVYRWRLTDQEIAEPGFGWADGHPDMDKTCVKFGVASDSHNLLSAHCISRLYVVCEQ